MADDKNSEEKLFKISRDAHKLTQMISSWPKGPNFDGRSKDITTSLLSGAFDLQESLITLRNLWEASNVMPHEKGELDREVEVGEVGFRLMASRRFERLAMDGSLFSYIDEMKKVIKESSCGDNSGIGSTDVERVSSSRSLKNSDLATETKKAKAPNLIAKLMGLQEFPSDTGHPTRKETKDVECVVQPKSILAIEMPRRRKPQSVEKKPELRTNTVKDIVEVVKSNELSEGDEIKDHTRMSCPGNQFDNQVPTNVHCCSGPRYHKVLVSKRTRATSLIPEETVCDNGEMLLRKFERKDVRNTKRNKFISSQKTVNLDFVGKQQRRKVVTGTREKHYAAPPPPVNGRRYGDRKEVKAIAGPKSQAKLISRSPPKSYRRSSIKNDISSNDRLGVSNGANAPRKHNLSSALKPVSQNLAKFSTVKKIAEVKSARRSMDINAATGNANCKDIRDSNQCYNLRVDAPPKQVESNSIACYREYKSKDSRIFCEAMVKSNVCNRSSRSPEESTELQNDKTIERAAAKLEAAGMKRLLLSSKSFISHAQEHFRLDLYQTASHQRKCTLKPRTRNAELLLGCAKELLVRKRHQSELSNHLMLRTTWCSLSSVVSLDQLADEISYGIEKLNDYSKNDAEVGLKESIYPRLERDVGGKDMVINAMWDVGWLNWICVEEADHIVGRVEELILCGLVKELVVEFVHDQFPSVAL